MSYLSAAVNERRKEYFVPNDDELTLYSYVQDTLKLDPKLYCIQGKRVVSDGTDENLEYKSVTYNVPLNCLCSDVVGSQLTLVKLRKKRDEHDPLV